MALLIIENNPISQNTTISVAAAQMFATLLQQIFFINRPLTVSTERLLFMPDSPKSFDLDHSTIYDCFFSCRQVLQFCL